MNRFLLLFCLITISLSAEDNCSDLSLSSPFEISDLSSSKEFLVGGIVNPLSGQICINKTDMVAKGAQEILVQRTYIPPFLPAKCHHNTELDKWQRYAYLSNNYRGFAIFPHCFLKSDKLHRNVKLVDQNGSVLEFMKAKDGYFLSTSSYGISNLTTDKPSGQYDLRNIRIEKIDDTFDVYFPDGTRRYYREKCGGNYLLRKEILPNGKVLKFDYNGMQLKKIESLDPQERHTYAEIEIKGSSESGRQEFFASSGAYAAYTFDKREQKVKGKNGRNKFEYMILSRPYLTSAEGSLLIRKPFLTEMIYGLPNIKALTCHSFAWIK